MYEELNKKLAEWAGFKQTEGGGWITPNSDKARLLCDFTQSLDACFEWLFPKLHNTHSIYMHFGKTLTTCVVSPYFNHPGSQSYEAQDKDLALALCLAIEKLMDGGKI